MGLLKGEIEKNIYKKKIQSIIIMNSIYGCGYNDLSMPFSVLLILKLLLLKKISLFFPF